MGFIKQTWMVMGHDLLLVKQQIVEQIWLFAFDSIKLVAQVINVWFHRDSKIHTKIFLLLLRGLCTQRFNLLEQGTPPVSWLFILFYCFLLCSQIRCQDLKTLFKGRHWLIKCKSKHWNSSVQKRFSVMLKLISRLVFFKAESHPCKGLHDFM